MHGRFSMLAALFAGALAAVAALPLVSACQRRSGDGSMLAPDAHAASQGSTPAPGVGLSGQVPSLAPLVKQLRPTVVNINSRFKPKRRAQARRTPQNPRNFNPDDQQDDSDPMERFFRFFGQPQPDERERQGLGSGFYIGDGYVLTNNHVVMVQDEQRQGRFRPMDEIKVITDETSPIGAREFPAKVVGADDKTDIALLRIEGKEVGQLRPAMLGDSDALEVGDYVIAIGEPFGLQATVTSGIVSAKERSQFGGPYSDYLQTDASINPGNSGGPLFNLKGEVVGVNSAIIAGANTIGFAIPIAVVKQILPQLREKGKVSRGFLGITPQAITQDMVDQLGLKSTKGALVADVVKGGPADKAGLKPGDVIVSLNGKPVTDNYQLTRDVGAIPPGSTVKLDVIRDGKQRTFEVKLGQRPEELDTATRTDADKGGDQSGGDPLGLSVEDLTPDLARRARVDEGTRGVVVTDVAPDSAAGVAGLEPGDVILEVNKHPVSSTSDYKKAIKGAKKGDTVLLRVRHGQATQYVPVKVR